MPTIRYTDEQRLALETRHVPVAVDAGAGCGKTFVLTERFLSHLDPKVEELPAELDELVAITFTDAAAREMRGRIRAKCRERLEAATGEEAAHWRRLLRALEGARVSTIHSFASGLIRDFAIELGVDPAYTVLDPAEAAVLKTACVDQALRKRLAPSQEGELDSDLIDTAAEFDIAGLRSRVRTMIDQVDQPGFKKWLRKSPDDLIDAWLTFYREEVAPKYADEFLSDPKIVELRELLSLATPTKPEFIERVVDLGVTLGNLANRDNADAHLKTFQELLGYHIPGTKKPIFTAKDWPDGETKKRFTAVRKALEEKLKKQRHAGTPESMYRAADLGLRVQRLAANAATLFKKAKQARGVLDNDDLLIEAHRLLTHPDLADARRRIAGRVRVLLVDEFQDSDRLQADLVQAIGGEETGKEPGRVFFVGDYKQSIYRFRGAEPQVFKEIQATTPPAGRLTLSKNFRSTPAVLEFVNTLFGPIFGEDYAPLHANRPQQTDGPAVELLWAPPPEEEANANTQRLAEARSIAGRIRAMCDSSDATVVDQQTREPRPAVPGDFAILFRALSDVPIYEEALRQAGLDYYLVGGHAFYAQQEIYDVLNLLRTVLSECDEIALAGALRSPLFGLQDETLFWLSRRGGLNAGLLSPKPVEELDGDQQRAVARARQTLIRLRRDKDRVGASELLQVAWDATGYDAALLAEFLGERKLANLEKLHEQARQADVSGSGLRGLVARLTEFVNQPPKEALAATTAGDAGVVRLMTVHGSKGLEFPIVVLADLNRKVQSDLTQAAFDPRLGPLVKPPAENQRNADDNPPVGLDFWKAAQRPDEEAERDRLFYVACTRAADRLILSSCWDADAKLEGPWLKRLSERFDLSTAEPVNDDTPGGLVMIGPPSEAAPPTAQQEGRSGPGLSDALESVLGQSPKPGAAPPAVGPIGIDPDAITTFSVSRLSGKLHTSAPLAESDDDNRVAEEVDPRRLGTLVHAIIERLEPGDPAMNRSIAAWTRSLAPQHLRRAVERGGDLAIEQVRRFVSSEDWLAMASADRLDREVEFLMRWPLEDDPKSSPTQIRGYLDGLYRNADGWHVIDYKTNSTTEAGVPKLAGRYALQMAVYAHAVEAATGERPASLTLSFLVPGVSHRVPWDAAAHAESISLISEALAAARSASAENSLPLMGRAGEG